MGPGDELALEVVYALPHRQLIVALQLPQGTTAREAVLASGLDQQFEGLDLATCKIGVFGSRVDDGHILRSGERVEIYRPLVADPKEVRRQLAAEGKTMGKG